MSQAGSLVINIRTSGVNQADADLRRIINSGSNTNVVINRLGSGFGSASNQAGILSNATSRLDAAFVSLVSVGTIKSITELTDSWTVLTNKLELARIGNEKVGEVQNRVFEIAQKTRSGLNETATLYARLERSMRTTGVTGTDLGRITETINKAMIISGATSNESAAALLQFSQAMASGVLRGDEFRSVAEQAPRLTQLLMESLNVSIGGLRKMAYAGELSSDIVIKAISESAEAIDKEFGRTMPTFNQQWVIATNNVTKFAGESTKSRAGVAALGSSIVGLSENLDSVVTVAGLFATILTARLVTGMAAKTAASIAATSAERLHTAQMTAALTVMQSSVGVAAQKAAADKAATATALAIARAEQQAAIGTNAHTIATQQLTVARRAHGVATAADITAQQALTAAMNTATAAATRSSAALAVARAGLALVGGPLGIAMLAAMGIMAYNAAQSAGVAESKEFAESVASTTLALENMTSAQLAATRVRAQAAAETLDEEYKKSLNIQKMLRYEIELGTEAFEKGVPVTEESARAAANLTENQRKLALEVENSEKLHKQFADTMTVVDNTANELIPTIANLANIMSVVGKINMDINLPTVAQEGFNKATEKTKYSITALEIEVDKGKRAATQYGDAVSAAGKQAGVLEPTIRQMVLGTANLTEEQRKSLKPIQDTIDASGKEFDLRQKLTESKKADTAASKAGASEAKSTTKVIQDYTDKVAEAESQINLTARARAVLTAQNKLGNAASKQDIDTVGQLAGKYYDLQKAISTVGDIDANRIKAQDDITASLSEKEQITIEANKRIAELTLQQQADDKANWQLYEDAKTAISKRADDQRIKNQEQAASNGIAVIQSSLGVMLDMAEEFGGKNTAMYKALFLAQKAFQVVSIIANAELAASAILAHDASIMGLGAVASAQLVRAMGYASAGIVGGLAIGGMAHDGIDNIPKEGTWLLDKGERVLNAPSNAKLNAFLDGQGNAGSGSGANNASIVQYITIQGAGDAQLAQALQQAARDGAEQGYNKVLQDFNGRGNIRKSALG